MVDLGLKNKVVVVTGSTRGIGLATAKMFLDAGARVVLNGRSQKNVDEIVEEYIREKRQVMGRSFDVSRAEEVEKAIQGIKAHWGGIDILVNNAGEATPHFFEEIAEEEWERVLATNLKGVFNTCKAVVPIMKTQNHGVIINIASEAGRTGSWLSGVHYSASKGGVLALTKALARAYGKYNIRVNAVSPGVIRTDLTLGLLAEKNFTLEDAKRLSPLQRIGEPHDVAAVVVFLASDLASFITGQTVGVNGGALMI